MRLNLEQSSDAQTMQIVERFHWEHGSTTIHRRVILGGLLPAVVESWYPTSNHSYGLLLEDDVEVSPMFYAWAKMAILRYRCVVTYRHGRKIRTHIIIQIWAWEQYVSTIVWHQPLPAKKHRTQTSRTTTFRRPRSFPQPWTSASAHSVPLTDPLQLGCGLLPRALEGIPRVSGCQAL